jgi:hypothetical protein
MRLDEHQVAFENPERDIGLGRRVLGARHHSALNLPSHRPNS